MGRLAGSKSERGGEGIPGHVSTTCLRDRQRRPLANILNIGAQFATQPYQWLPLGDCASFYKTHGNTKDREPMACLPKPSFFGFPDLSPIRYSEFAVRYFAVCTAKNRSFRYNSLQRIAKFRYKFASELENSLANSLQLPIAN